VFTGGLVFKARRLCASLNSRLESNKERRYLAARAPPIARADVRVLMPHAASHHLPAEERRLRRAALKALELAGKDVGVAPWACPVPGPLVAPLPPPVPPTSTPPVPASATGLGRLTPGVGFRVQGAGVKFQGSWFRVSGLGFRVSGVGCRVEG